MDKQSIWGEPIDVLVKGENDQGVPYTRVTSYAAGVPDGFLVLTLSEVVQRVGEGAERVNSVMTDVQFVDDLPERIGVADPYEEPGGYVDVNLDDEPCEDPGPDGFDDVREALAVARSLEHTNSARLANLGHVMSRMSEEGLPEDLNQVDRAELDALAESLAEAAGGADNTPTEEEVRQSWHATGLKAASEGNDRDPDAADPRPLDDGAVEAWLQGYDDYAGTAEGGNEEGDG